MRALARRGVAALAAAVDDGVAQLGRLDIVSASAGICTVQARLGHGRLRRIDTYTDVAPALSAIFAR